MQANSAGFLESVAQNFRHSMTFLDLPERWPSGSFNATRPIRPLRRQITRPYVHWRSVHSEHSEPVKGGIRYAPNADVKEVEELAPVIRSSVRSLTYRWRLEGGHED